MPLVNDAILIGEDHEAAGVEEVFQGYRVAPVIDRYSRHEPTGGVSRPGSAWMFQNFQFCSRNFSSASFTC